MISGDKVGNYTVVEQIGAGGFGEVFRAINPTIEREVAIKVLHPRYSSDSDAIARLIVEARAVNLISHPSIVEVFDFGTLADGRAYIVMELIDGETLRAHLERGRVAQSDALRLLSAIAEAVDAAHRAGVAHRDLKPDNIFICRDGSVKLIDFGLSSLERTEDEHIHGTPLYMSPEQCRGRGVDVRSDAYSFGVLAYELLTGAPPFRGDPIGLALQHLNEPAPATDLVPRIDRVVARLLAKDPDSRPTKLSDAVAAMKPRRPIALRVAAVALCASGASFAVASYHHSESIGIRTRTLELRSNGPIDELHFAPNGDLIYVDGRTVWRGSLATREFVRVPLASNVESAAPTTHGYIECTNISEGTQYTLGSMSVATHAHDCNCELAPDERTLGCFEDDAITTHDLFTHEQHIVVPNVRYTVNEVRWSPDGHRFAWDDAGKIEVVRIADGIVRDFAVPIRDQASAVAIAWLDNSHIAYCGGSPVAIHSLGVDSVTDRVIMPTLHEPITNCNFAADAERMFVAATSSPAAIGWLDTGTAAGVQLHRSEVDHWITAIESRDLVDAASAPAEDMPSTPVQSASIDLVGGGERAIRTCTPLSLAVRRGSRVVDAAHEHDALVFRARESCAELARWALPPGGIWQAPSCREHRCAIVRITNDLPEDWLLEADGKMRRLNPPRDGWIELAPDERHVAIMERDQTTVLDVDTGSIDVVPSHGMEQQSLVFGRDSETFYVSGAIEGIWAVREHAPSGERTVWSSPSRWFLAQLFADGRVYGRTRNYQQTFLMLER